MWAWSSKHFPVRDLSEEPALGEFAGGLVVNGAGSLDPNASVLSRYPMRALPLIEWPFSAEVPGIFDTLRGAGARRGFFIDYPADEVLGPRFRECDLSARTADLIVEEDLFGLSTIFVDDLFLSVIATWFSDYTLLCMTPEVFGHYLRKNPLLLDLDGDESEVPADTFETALRGAFKRLDAWSPRTASLKRELEWQLVSGAPS
jgi:hypothetical protein